MRQVHSNVRLGLHQSNPMHMQPLPSPGMHARSPMLPSFQSNGHYGLDHKMSRHSLYSQQMHHSSLGHQGHMMYHPMNAGSGHKGGKRNLPDSMQQGVISISDLRKSDVGFLWFVMDVYGNRRKLNSDDVIEHCPSCKIGPPIHWSNIRNKRGAKKAHDLRCNRQSKGNCDYDSSRERALKRKQRQAEGAAKKDEKGSKSNAKSAKSSTSPKQGKSATKESKTQNSSARAAKASTPRSATSTTIGTKKPRVSKARANSTKNVDSGSQWHVASQFKKCNVCAEPCSVSFNFCPFCGAALVSGPSHRVAHGVHGRRQFPNFVGVHNAPRQTYLGKQDFAYSDAVNGRTDRMGYFDDGSSTQAGSGSYMGDF